MDYWREPITEELARKIMGNEHFEYAVTAGSAYCCCRATGSWDANLAESFAAYKCAQRVAEAA